MKRNFLSFALAVLTVASACAIPAKRLVKAVSQPDGTTVSVTLVGDELFHSYVTADGLTIDFTPEGYAVYRTSDGLTSMYAHEQSMRTAAEQAFIAAEMPRIAYNSRREASAMVQEKAKQSETTSQVKMTNSGNRISIEQQDSQVPHKGVANVPIILVEYSDIKFRDGNGAAQTFQDFFMGEGKSAAKYFKDASLGQYDPQFHIIGPYTLPQKRAYYGSNDWYGNDKELGQMIKEAVQFANIDTDFSIFDNDDDGECDVVIVLYAGVGEASSGVSNSVWPCQWSLSSAGKGAVNCDGVKVDKFAVFNELNGEMQTQIDGIGTFCHEFSHCLGLPDFYDTDYGGHFGMDAWSLMDYGPYNDNGYTPVGYSAYEKAFMGWMELTPGQKNGKYTLPVQNNADDPQNYAVVLTNKKDPNEYFIFENRAQQGWDLFMQDQGMLITHVTYLKSAWVNNEVNNYALQRMTPVPADNRLTTSTMSKDLWPKSNATEFTDRSVPAARVNTGTYLSQPVTNITRDSETGVVKFWIDPQPATEIDAPEPEEPTVDDAGDLVLIWPPIEIIGTDVVYTLRLWPAETSTPDDGEEGLSVRRAEEVEDDAEPEGAITITGITEPGYRVTGLTAGKWNFCVKAAPVDPDLGLESAWSETKSVELTQSGIADITAELPQTLWRIVNGEVVTVPGARLYSVSGIEVKAVSSGRFAPASGAYILVAPGARPVKVVL